MKFPNESTQYREARDELLQSEMELRRQTADGAQMPMFNVFVKDKGMRHFWGSELLYAKSEPGQDPRHADLLWPLWNVLDLTPQGRRSDWYPKLDYPA